MKKFLISGGSGFIGSNLTLELQKRYPDAEIVVYDNLMCGSWKNLVGFKGQFVNHWKEIPLVHPEIKSETKYGLATYVTKDPYFDTIFHLGANTDTTNGSINSHIENNLNDCKKYLGSGKTIIYASSASVYGVGATKPSVETDELKPANAYAFSKMQLENYMRKYYPNNSIGFRFFNVYGDKEGHKKHSKSMVSQILSKVKRDKNVELFPDGNQVRDFVYVKDVVDLLIKAAEQPKSGIYNLGFGSCYSFNQLFEGAKLLYPESKSEIIWKDNPYSFFQSYTCSDNRLTEKTFSWLPKYNVIKGIKDYYENL